MPGKKEQLYYNYDNNILKIIAKDSEYIIKKEYSKYSDSRLARAFKLADEQYYSKDGKVSASVMVVTCCDCGKKVLEYYGVVTEEGFVCLECKKKHYKCSICNKLFDTANLQVATQDGPPARVCSTCAKKHCAKCNFCGKLFIKKDSLDVKHKGVKSKACLVCLHKYFARCYHCNLIVHRDDIVVNSGGCCAACYDAYYFTCEQCDQVLRREARNESGSNLCQNCFRKKWFHNARWTPTPFLVHTCDDAGYESPLLGCKLEIDEGNFKEAIKDLHKMSDEEHLFYLKKDGSLSSRGIEVVTHPCSVDFHTRVFPWAQICDVARKHNYKSYVGESYPCGLHVHVSKSFLTELEQTRLSMFICSHKAQAETFAQRLSNKYCLFVDPEDIKACLSRERKRYEAVNCCNGNTVEFRLFSSTLQPKVIIASLQFCCHLCYWIKTINDDFCTTPKAWEDFVAYVATGNKSNNACLLEYLKEKKLFTPT